MPNFQRNFQVIVVRPAFLTFRGSARVFVIRNSHQNPLVTDKTKTGINPIRLKSSTKMSGGTHRLSHIVVSSSHIVVFSSHIVVSSRVILVAPQLWCSCPTTVVQLPHSCGAIAPQLWGNGNNGETNSFLTFGNGETGWKFGIRN